MNSVPPIEPPEKGERELFARIQSAAELLVIESHHAGWERPWRSLTPEAWGELFSVFGERMEGARVETGANREFARRFGLEIIPTLLILLGGVVVARLTGSVQVGEAIEAMNGVVERKRALAVAAREMEGGNGPRRLPAPRSILRRRSGVPRVGGALATPGVSRPGSAPLSAVL